MIGLNNFSAYVIIFKGPMIWDSFLLDIAWMSALNLNFNWCKLSFHKSTYQMCYSNQNCCVKPAFTSFQLMFAGKDLRYLIATPGALSRASIFGMHLATTSIFWNLRVNYKIFTGDSIKCRNVIYNESVCIFQVIKSKIYKNIFLLLLQFLLFMVLFTP